MQRTVISARGNNNLIELQEQCGPQWITIDRYTAVDLTKPIKRQSPWIDSVRALCSQPSAEVVIEMPPMPTLEMSQAEKLEAMMSVNNERRFIIERGLGLTDELTEIVKQAESRVECT